MDCRSQTKEELLKSELQRQETVVREWGAKSESLKATPGRADYRTLELGAPQTKFSISVYEAFISKMFGMFCRGSL